MYIDKGSLTASYNASYCHGNSEWHLTCLISHDYRSCVATMP